MPPRRTRPKKKKPDVLPLPSTGAAPRKDIDKQQSKKKKKKQKTGHEAPTTKEAHLNNIQLEQEAGDSTAEAMTTWGSTETLELIRCCCHGFGSSSD